MPHPAHAVGKGSGAGGTVIDPDVVRMTFLLLEEPTNGVYPELLVPLVHTIRWARSRGSAVVWLTAAAAIWNDPSIPATRRYRLVGRQFMEMSRVV